MKMTYAEFMQRVLDGLNAARGELEPEEAEKVAMAIRDSFAMALHAGGDSPVAVVEFINIAHSAILSEITKPVTH